MIAQVVNDIFGINLAESICDFPQTNNSMTKSICIVRKKSMDFCLNNVLLGWCFIPGNISR